MNTGGPPQIEGTRQQSRQSRTWALRTRWRILPRDGGAAPLDVVIGVMAFLAALALGGVMIADRLAMSWQGGLTGQLTVQVLPQDGTVPPDQVTAALALLRSTDGVVSAAPLSDEENLELVAPWLGSDASLLDLPFPTLIEVELAPGANVDVAALDTALRAAAPNSVLDDHRRWLERLRSTANTVVLGAAGVLMLIGAATVATVAFATRAGLAAHRDIVELLHLMGAQDRFIARAFERHHLIGTALAASAGAAMAMGVFLAAGGLEEIGVASVAFLPPLGLRLEELPWLLTVPAAAAIIAWGTARFSVLSALRERY